MLFRFFDIIIPRSKNACSQGHFLRGCQYHSRAQHGKATAVKACASRPPAAIIPHENKIFVKFSFLTGILYPLCYNENTKGRGDRIDSIEKSRISGCTAYLRSCDALLRSMAWRGGDRVKQGDPAVFGVCGNWMTKVRRRKRVAYRSFSHAFEDCSRQEQHC